MSAAPGRALTLSVTDCARATGLSAKAIRRRIERGTLDSVLVDGQRRVPIASLVGAGLLIQGLGRGERGAAAGQAQPAAVLARLAAQRQRLAEQVAGIGDLEGDVRRIAEQLRRERARCRELEYELVRARQRISELERRPAHLSGPSAHRPS
jgi:hypothetical protein